MAMRWDWLTPSYTLWRQERDRHAVTRRRLMAAEEDLQANRAHLALAVEQRQQVMAAFRAAKARAEALEAQVADLRCQLTSLLNQSVLGDEGSYGCWIDRGEGPPA